MRDEIESIYVEKLILERKENPQFDNIASEIEFAAERNNVSLRADSLYFCARNFEDMIIEPAQLAVERELIGKQDFADIISHDAGFLFQSIRHQFGRVVDKPLSSTEILFLLAENFHDLKLAQMTLWGDEEDENDVRR